MVVHRKVLVRYTIEVPVEIPYYWDADRLAFHREDSSSCANNIINWDFALAAKDGCMCEFLKRAELVRELDPTPIRRTKSESQERDLAIEHWGRE